MLFKWARCAAFLGVSAAAIVARGQVTGLSTNAAAATAVAGEIRNQDASRPDVRAFGDTYDLSAFWQCDSDCGFLVDTGGGPGPCVGLTYDGNAEVCGTNVLSGADVEVIESETVNGDGTTTVIVEVRSANGGDLVPNNTQCAANDVIDVVGVHLGCDTACGGALRTVCNSASGGDDLDPNLPIRPYALIEAKARIFGFGGMLLLEFDLATAGQSVNELGTQFTLGGVNQVVITALQFYFVIDTGAPTGACCETNGVCSNNVTESECNMTGDYYLGDGSICPGPICATSSADTCNNAQTVTDGVYAFDTTSLGLDPLMPAPCDPDMGNDVILHYNCTCTGDLTIETCGGADTVLEVFDGQQCPPGASVGCSDDATACGPQDLGSFLELPVNLGDDLTIRLGASSGADINGSVSIDCEARDCNSNGAPDDADILAGTSPDCNSNAIPDECDIAGGTGADLNSNGAPDACDIAEGTSDDCNTNGIPDEQEIAEGSAPDANANGHIDECDIAECSSYDLNHNGIPDEADIIFGTAQDANNNDIIDEAEQPDDQHSYIYIPGGSLRDDDVAALLKNILVNTNGTPNVKDAKFLFAQCFGGGMLDDIADQLGTSIPWVAGSASRHDESSFGQRDNPADPSAPLDRWVQPLPNALKGRTFFRGLKKAAREDLANPLNRDALTERPQYRVSGPAGRAITLKDPDASSHHAVLVAGDPDGQRHRNDIRKFCDLLEQEWGDLNTTGTSVHILYGDGMTNPCSGDVPDGNVSAASATNFNTVLTNLRNQLGPGEEFVLFVSDHGDADVEAVNDSRSLRGAVVSLNLDVPAGYVIALTRDPFNNKPYIAVVATGAYAAGTIPVQFNGVSIGHLDPTAINGAGENETLFPVRETQVDVGVNTVTVDPSAAAGVTIVSARLDLDGINTIPSPGWGDADGDGDVDHVDAQWLSDCRGGPGGGLLMPGCENVDIDDDADVDLDDYRLFQTVFTGAF